MNKYIRFLLLSDEIETIFDHTERYLFNLIAVRHFHQNPMRVTEAMHKNMVASPATIHRKLDNLREKGLIDTQYEGKNRRTKFLVLTPMGVNYLHQKAAAMKLAHE